MNQNGVWPWRDQDQILIPLEQNSGAGILPANGPAGSPSHNQPETVEIYFSSDAGKADAGALALDLLAPKFDLPLENLTWRVFLNDKWRVEKWRGAMQLQQQEIVADGGTLNLQGYLQSESMLQQQKTQEAEQMLALANSALQNGNPQQARQAFESAAGLSQHDEAFNEDARVQLNKLKLQQALVGLNVRQNAVSGGGQGGAGGALNELRNSKDANYTQQQAQQIFDNDSAEQYAALMNLADQLIKQQDAAVANPAAIRANIPEQGRLLTFKRAVVVDDWANLNIGLEARVIKTAPWPLRLLVLAITALVLGALGLLARIVAKTQPA